VNSYTSNENINNRLFALSQYGHDSSIWSYSDSPESRGHLIEILSPNYLSQPCWNRLFEVADYCYKVNLNFKEDDLSEVFQFFFIDIGVARQMALKVQSSARNKRKDLVRNLRLVEAGGFHSPEVIEQLFSIQQGKCYYSGELLSKSPKNYVVDHIHPIFEGGTDWPINLALVLSKINTWKGGHSTSVETLKWLSKSKDNAWLTSQKAFCEQVDKKRTELDKEFRAVNEKLP
jgi:5-methylcytosine-specific restriction endonuclease McrA